jgi:hypothetical protein
LELVMEGSMGLFGRFYAKEKSTEVSCVELRPRGDSYVRIDGTDYAIRTWGPSGFLVAPYSGALAAGQIARVRFVLREFHDNDGELRIDDQVLIESIDNAGLRARWWHLPTRKSLEIAGVFSRKAAATV